MDIKITGANIYDGTGGAPFYGDIGIVGQRVAAIGCLNQESARMTIDGEGLIACPGFIDVHSHTDMLLLINPLAESKLCQGVTTEIIGNCGDSAMPITANDLAWQELEKHCPDLFRWERSEQFFTKLEQQGIGINIASLIGHGMLRNYVLGHGSVGIDSEHLETMEKVLSQELAQGAIGLSTGLIYSPGCFAGISEINSLCKKVAEAGGVYTSHIRDEADEVLSSVQEVIETSMQTGVRAVISHHKAKGKANWGKTQQTIDQIRKARSMGHEIYCDVYPYTALCTSLKMLLPQWSLAGGVPVMVERLENAATCARILKETTCTLHAEQDNIYLSQLSLVNRAWDGKTLGDYACALGFDAASGLLHLLRSEHGGGSQIHFAMCEDDIKNILKADFSMIGSDAAARTYSGPLAQGKPHPRGFGTFPRILAKYVKEEQVLSLSKAIHKMTGLPAKVFSLQQRGYIQRGYYADIVLFDYNTIKDNGTFENPCQRPTGIEYVFVNGALAVQKGNLTGMRAGKPLYKTGLIS